MTASRTVTRPLVRCLRQAQVSRQLLGGNRSFTITFRSHDDAAIQATPAKPALDPNTVTSSREERRLMKSGILPIGSRRRRAALRTSGNLPFEQLPYHCFQEARKVLQEEREEILEKITKERLRISNLLAQDASKIKGGQVWKNHQLRHMRKYLEELKIHADINDPLVKKRFEDGFGDMDKPIYRHLANQKWRSYRRKYLVQRIEQFSIVPDLLPTFEPTASVEMAFRRFKVKPGDYVDSRRSELPANLKIQVFHRGERLITILMIDPDVPDAEKDNYMHRCHFLAVNIPISPTKTPVSCRVDSSKLVLPWMTPFAQKGTQYHRYSIFVLQQPKEYTLDVVELRKETQRDNFSLREFIDRHKLYPIGLSMFRSIWDEGTARVMHQASIPGADIVFKQKKVIALKPKKQPRGWDAKHAHPKYDAMMGKNRPPFRKMFPRR